MSAGLLMRMTVATGLMAGYGLWNEAVRAQGASPPVDGQTVPANSPIIAGPSQQPSAPVSVQPVPQPVQRPVIRVADTVAATPTPPPQIVRPDLSPAGPNEHPLMPALRWAYAGIDGVRAIEDYSCTFVKRERVDGELMDHEYMFMKVRHRPFSVYLYFLGPASLKGREAIYIEGQNNGKMWAHTTGLQDRAVGTVSLAPDGMIAMRGNRYPMTEAGILNMLTRLIVIGEKDSKYGECEVKFYPGAKVSKRKCTCIEVKHPTPRRNFLFHLARIFVDDELNLPIRYEAYTWPTEPGGPPILTEEYTYLNLKLNNGFTDIDFSKDNPEYHFRR